MSTTLIPETGLDLTADDRVLLHAIGMAGDEVREPDVTYLLERWPWAAPMDWERVEMLEAEGLLERTDRGWFVPFAVESAVAAELPRELDPLLKGFVGEMLCRHADSFDRFQLGFRRMIAGGREHALVAASRAWGRTPAAQSGPRGSRFVEALGSRKLSPELRVQLSAAVPDLSRRVDWAKPLRMLGERVSGYPGVARAAAAAAAVGFLAIDALGIATTILQDLDRR